MGAVALSERDEMVLESLKKVLGVPSKSQVVHRALEELQTSMARRDLARRIQESVRKCARADFKENQNLTGAFSDRLEKE